MLAKPANAILTCGFAVHSTSLLVFAAQLYETPPSPPPDFINELYDNTRTPARAAVRVFRLDSSAQNYEQDRLLTASKYTRHCSARPRTGVCRTAASHPTGKTVLSNERLQNLSLGDQDGRPQHSGLLSHLNALPHIPLMNNTHLTLHMGKQTGNHSGFVQSSWL
jgi:hypothetical protein